MHTAREGWIASTFLILSLILIALFSLWDKIGGAVTALASSSYGRLPTPISDLFDPANASAELNNIVSANPIYEKNAQYLSLNPIIVIAAIFIALILFIHFLNFHELLHGIRAIRWKIDNKIFAFFPMEYGYFIYLSSKWIGWVYGWLGAGWRAPATRLACVSIGLYAIERLFAFTTSRLPDSISNNATNRSIYILANITIPNGELSHALNASVLINPTGINNSLIYGTTELINNTQVVGYQVSQISRDALLGNPVSGLLTFVAQDWEIILVAWFLLEMIMFALNSTNQLIIDEETDYTKDEKDKSSGSNSDDKENSSNKLPPKGLADLLIVYLNRINELYLAVNEKRAIPSKSGIGRPIDATMKTEDLSDILQSTSVGSSELALGPIKVPIASFSLLLGRIFRGPRIVVSLHKNKDGKIYLTANMTGKNGTGSWIVNSQEKLERDSEEDFESQESPRSIEDMMLELAERISVSLKGDSDKLVSWRSSYRFNKGLRAYRESLLNKKSRYYSLKEAEKRFIQALNESDKVTLAYYNLGVVYTELKQLDAAESAFLRSIEKDPNLWEAYYAMGLSLFSRAQNLGKNLCSIHDMMPHIDSKFIKESPKNPFEEDFCGNFAPNFPFDCAEAMDCISDLKKKYTEIEMLFEHVIFRNCLDIGFFKRDYSQLAKVYNLKGHAQNYLWKLEKTPPKTQGAKGKDHLSLSRRCFEKAVGYSWTNLAVRELEGTAGQDEKNIVSECTIDLAGLYLQAYMSLDDENKTYLVKLAKNALIDAINVDPAKADLHFMLGIAHCCQDRFDSAANEFKYAAGIAPENSKFWASLAVAYAYDQNKSALVQEQGSCNKKEAAINACSRVATFGEGASYKALKTAIIACGKLGEEEDALRYHRASIVAQLKECAGMEKFDICFIKRNLKKCEHEKCEHECDAWTYAQLVLQMCSPRDGDCEKDHTACDDEYRFDHCVDIAIDRLKSEIQDFSSNYLWRDLQDGLLLAKLYIFKEEKPTDAIYLLQYIKRQIEGQIELRKADRCQCVNYRRCCLPEVSCILISMGQIYLEGKLDDAMLVLEKKSNSKKKSCEELVEDCFKNAISILETDTPEEIKRLGLHELLCRLGLEKKPNSKMKSCAELAEECFRDAISILETDCPEEIKRLGLHALLGRSLLKQDNRHEALKEAKEARITKPIHKEELKVIGNIYCRAKEYEKACRALEACRAFNVDGDASQENSIEDPDTLMRNGIVHLDKALNNCEKGRRREEILKKALDYFTRAQKIYDMTSLDRRWRARYYIGKVYLEQCRYDDAISHFLILCNLKPIKPEGLIANLRLGHALLKKGSFVACEKQYINTITEWCRLMNIEDENEIIRLLAPHPLEKKEHGQIGAMWLRPFIKENKKKFNEKVAIPTGSQEDTLPMGLIISYAMIGLASSYAKRDANLMVALGIVRKVELLMAGLDDEFRDEEIECTAERLDCLGWILYKMELFYEEEEKDRLSCSISYLEASIAAKASPGAYLHLADAYRLRSKRMFGHENHTDSPTQDSLKLSKLKLGASDESGQGEANIASRQEERANACCRHARELDIRGEYKNEISDLEKRLGLESATADAKGESSPIVK